MAKLSRGNLAAQKSVPSSKVDDWNPPIVTSATSTAALMLPPKSRPLPKLPTTPSHKSLTNSANSERQDSSSKKKRRRRGGKRIGDSASEVTTNPSEDVARDTTPPVNVAPEVLVPASQSSVSALPPNASAEEIRVFQNEPELYGVYASSDEGEEDEIPEEQSVVVQFQSARAPAYSPSIATRYPQSSPIGDMRDDSESSSVEEPTKPQIGSDIASVEEDQIPAPEKMANGRFKCPVAAKYGCDQTFAQAKGARRHADQHLNADKFKCKLCGKTYSRKDTFERHLKSQHKSGTKGAGVDKKSYDHLASTLPNGNVAAPVTNRTSVPVDDDADVNDSYESGTEDEHESPILHDKQPIDQEHTTTQNNSSRKKKQSSNVNGHLKRKRPTPQPSSTSKMQSRKRLRRDETLPNSKFQHVNMPKPISTVTKSPDVPSIAESGHSDMEISSADDRDQETHLDTQNIADAVADTNNGNDVNMMDRDQTEESDGDSASDSVATTNAESANDDDESGEEQNAGQEEYSEGDVDEEVEEDITQELEPSETPIAQSEPPKAFTRRSKESDSGTQRQSSMDSFVHRSKSATTSTRASASGSRISVDVPVRSKVQSKLTPHIPIAVHNSTKNNVNYSTDSDGDDQPENSVNHRPNGSKPTTIRNKGKGRALSKQPHEDIVNEDAEEESASEDRPRATRIARRTSSATSRSAPHVRNRAILSKGKKKVLNSENSTNTEKPKSKPQAKSRKPTKKKAKNAASEDSSEDRDSSKRQTSTFVANSTWREASKSGVTGKFTEKEIRILHAWRDSFCKEYSMTAYEFNDMMANTASISKTDWRYGNWITKSDFMQQYYEQLPYRNRRSMIRFRERRFQNADSSPWTEAHDKELRQLVAELGTKWVEIAQLMGRTQDAVSQRWRHKLNYGEKPALMGEWTEEEVKKLEEEVIAFAQMKKTTPDDETLQIPWTAISKKLSNGRTAQQCSNRWRINTSKRVNGKFVKVPHNDRIPGEKAQKPRTPSKMEQRLSGRVTPKINKVYKSAERVEESEGDSGKNDDEGKDDYADDESEDSQVNDEPKVDEAESDGEASDQDKEESEADTNEQEVSENRRSEGDAMNDSEPEDIHETQSDASSHTQPSPVPSTQQRNASKIRRQKTQLENGGAPQEASSSRSKDRNMLHNSQSQSSFSTQSQSQPPPSSLPPTFKTPAISRNPLKRAVRNQITPGNNLSLSQLHAGTQADSSAKRTTARTNRTRVPDSAIVENRPSPQLDLLRRPIRSSSPSMTPLPDRARRDSAIDEEEEEEESNSDGSSSSEDAGTDVKSPASFLSARDTAAKSDENEADNGDSGTDSDSDSSGASNSQVDKPTRTSQNTDQDSSSTFWQSVNQNLRKLTGLSQSQSQDRKGRVSLADVLRRGAAIEESGSNDDDD